ncbi:hypothetical protein SD72_09610 [Leucobacter komagatae]|uniref:Uncharacterized protein n=1 Tax=Leucobacter komagatae TaxID=55969 RepID=A0A0D0IS29_9MICO|nr:hypothetical protein SD72_09610 [Leucobacter komagatae]
MAEFVDCTPAAGFLIVQASDEVVSAQFRQDEIFGPLTFCVPLEVFRYAVLKPYPADAAMLWWLYLETLRLCP